MNEIIYHLWAKVEWAKKDVQSAYNKIEAVLDEFDELSTHLEEQMLEDSDSDTFSDAVAKYEAMAKLDKEDVTEARN